MSNSNQDNKQDSWKELCSWVEKNIFNYEDNQKLQKAACLVLQGLKSGQVVANNNCEKHGEYSYQVILMTFKLYKNQILLSICGKNFDSERNKMSYIAAIVRDKINDVNSRYINAQKSQKKIDKINTDVITYEGAEYKKRETKESDSKKFDELW